MKKLILFVIFVIGVFLVLYFFNWMPKNDLGFIPNHDNNNRSIVDVGNTETSEQKTNKTTIEPKELNIQQVCPYGELCSSEFKEYSYRIFCNGKCERKLTYNCNFNKVCEGFENEKCFDCQCFDGLVCGGICYRNVENRMCENGLIVKNTSSAIKLEAPRFIKLGDFIRIVLTIKNEKNEDVNVKLVWSTDKIDIINKTAEVLLSAKETKNISFELKGTEVTDSLSGQNMETAYLQIDSNLGSAKREFIIYDSFAKKCADGYFNFKGVCVGEIFLLDGDCDSGENCIDRINDFSSKNERPITGEMKVGIVIVDLPSNVFIENLLEIGKNVSKYYRTESIKYTGKDLLNLSFEFVSNFSLGVENYGDLSRGWYSSDLYKKLKAMDFSGYHAVLVLLPNIPMSGGEAGGIYNGGKFILINAITYTDIAIAHEISHFLGCKDIYEKEYLCKNRWKGSLLCEEQGEKDVWRTELGNCAYEMGWI